MLFQLGEHRITWVCWRIKENITCYIFRAYLLIFKYTSELRPYLAHQSQMSHSLVPDGPPNKPQPTLCYTANQSVSVSHLHDAKRPSRPLHLHVSPYVSLSQPGPGPIGLSISPHRSLLPCCLQLLTPGPALGSTGRKVNQRQPRVLIFKRCGYGWLSPLS